MAMATMFSEDLFALCLPNEGGFTVWYFIFSVHMYIL